MEFLKFTFPAPTARGKPGATKDEIDSVFQLRHSDDYNDNDTYSWLYVFGGRAFVTVAVPAS